MPAVFTCSIDDGHPLDLRTAGLLAKHGLEATFYIPVQNREGPHVLGRQELRELGQRFEIGSHTFEHCFLKYLTPEQASFQVREGKARLEELLGKPIAGFCYPGGKYLRQHVDLVRAAGFRYARTTENLCFDGGLSPFEMPTTLQFFPHGRDVYLRNFVRGGNWARRQEALMIVLRHPHWLDRLYALFERSLQRNGVFHLWGHSSDIEAAGAWDEFDRFLGHVASCVPRRNRLSNEVLAARSFRQASVAPATA